MFESKDYKLLKGFFLALNIFLKIILLYISWHEMSLCVHFMTTGHHSKQQCYLFISFVIWSKSICCGSVTGRKKQLEF